MANETMQPIIVLPENMISDEDKQRLRDNGLCVVEAKDPSAVKFIDPIPSMAQRTKIEDAAIGLSRRLLTADSYNVNRSDVARMYVDLLITGTALDKNPTMEEREQIARNNARIAEAQRLGREDARKEREAAKAAKAAKKPTP